MTERFVMTAVPERLVHHVVLDERVEVLAVLLRA